MFGFSVIEGSTECVINAVMLCKGLVDIVWLHLVRMVELVFLVVSSRDWGGIRSCCAWCVCFVYGRC